MTQVFDIAVIGGGVNGCGIARDAVGRGLSVYLCEQGDLAQATSSASTKLFHGGLRYLEYYEFRLVREALIERETLLRAMPHISWPLRFVLPHHAGLRPAWLVRLGLFIYDHLGGRKILPGTRSLDLTADAAGKPLKDEFAKGFEYSDCWVEDSRLVVLNARDAMARGATVETRTRCLSAARDGDAWRLEVQSEDAPARTIRARAVVNAGGPWVEDILRGKIRLNTTDKIRLVRGSHIVTKKLFDHDRAYIFQGSDGRVVFAIPYETDFTLVGTTDREHDGAPGTAQCTDEEADYLRKAVSEYLKTPVAPEDVVWRYSGVRPLYDDGAKSATAATRDYVLRVEDAGGKAPALNVFGGKITTYRRLAEAALEKLRPFFPEMKQAWTAGVAMPGGDFPHDGVGSLIDGLKRDYPFLDDRWARRLVRAYGTQARDVLGEAKQADDLGRRFGWTLTEAEVRWLMDNEWARTADDVLWRRSKMGLRLSKDEAAALDDWMRARRGDAMNAA
jgi:glycerol-3-phosphate dehydrogenase